MMPTADRPILGPSRKLDFELETAFVIGEGNELGEAIPVSDAEKHIFGMVLLNDWSARDIRQWEYVPLRPFNSKTFATSISPWVVTLQALEPFRVESPEQAPERLSYLWQSGKIAYDLNVEVALKLRNASSEVCLIYRTNFRYMYWAMAQQLAHHTISGCNTRIGDLMGSGTISGVTDDSYGSLLELTWNGRKPLVLAGGATRVFLRLFSVINTPIKSMGFFAWLGLSRGFEQHAASLRNGLRMQAQTRPARARRRHSELWQRRATTPDGERRDLIGMFITGNSLKDGDEVMMRGWRQGTVIGWVSMA